MQTTTGDELLILLMMTGLNQGEIYVPSLGSYYCLIESDSERLTCDPTGSATSLTSHSQVNSVFVAVFF